MSSTAAALTFPLCLDKMTRLRLADKVYKFDDGSDVVGSNVTIFCAIESSVCARAFCL